jgi:site-specific DNA recombinase
MRILGRIRLSRSTDESTSEDRQREIIEGFARTGEHEIIGWAIDMDVSGSLSPFEAPKLGDWLKNRAAEFDGIAGWKLDRFGRTLFGLNDLFRWCTDERKVLVCVSDHIDLSHWTGRLVAAVIAGVAEGELEAIKERTSASHAKIRELGRWHGGQVPYGYVAVQRDGGWWLEPDVTRMGTVAHLVRAVAAGRGRLTLAKDLNERGISGPRGGKWSGVAVTRIVQSRWVLGQAKHAGQVVIGEDGLPAQRAEPLVPFDTWQLAQAVMRDQAKPRTRSDDESLLLDVAFCWECGSKLYRHIGRVYGYWRCSGRVKRLNDCAAPSIRAEDLEPIAEQEYLEKVGDREVADRVYVPGDTNAVEQRQRIDDAVATARREKDLGLYDGDESSYLARLTALVERRRALDDSPVVEAHWEFIGTGITYRERWNTSQTTAEKRQALLDSGIKIRARTKPSEFHTHVPLDVLASAIPGFVVDAPTDV